MSNIEGKRRTSIEGKRRTSIEGKRRTSIEGKRRTKGKRVFDLEDRLIDFAVRIIRMAESLPRTRAANHIAGQLVRCGTSSPPNYGEAQSAESRADFTHKMKVCLKELRETRVWLLMIERVNLAKCSSELEFLINESNELISIFVSSVKTAKQKSGKTS
jgi:four helix bundle protein